MFSPSGLFGRFFCLVAFRAPFHGDFDRLVDGVRINNRLYAGTTPLDSLPASMVERIEVIQGGESLFYGTQAVAGAVNVITKSFSGKPDGAVIIRSKLQIGKVARSIPHLLDEQAARTPDAPATLGPPAVARTPTSIFPPPPKRPAAKP